MSDQHLSTGAAQPPKQEGKLRLYSMKFCPYAQRARLVLLAKGVPHDIVNVNLINKPEWLTSVHPEGKVPALDTGLKIVVESLDIAEYLDQEYPEPPLYPAEPAAREQDKALIGKIGPLTTVFYTLILSPPNPGKTAGDWLKEFQPHLQIFEEELEKRGSTYFGGNKPGMVDYMLWPWAERAGTVGLSLGEALPVTDDQFPKLRAWKKAIRNDPVVDAIYLGPEKFYTVVQFKTKGLPADYDSV